MGSLGPTGTLPPLGRLLSLPSHSIHLALQSLRSVYFPRSSSTIFLSKSTSLFAQQVLPRGGDETPFIDSGYASAEEDEDAGAIVARVSLAPAIQTKLSPSPIEEALELLRDDPFERMFAIKWLTGFIARADMWVADVEEGSVEMTSRSDLLEEATAVLSSFICEKDQDDFDLTRSFTFPTSECGESPPVMVELNDAPVSNEDHTSVGLQSWGCCILFAEKLSSSQQTYLIDPRRQEDKNRPLRILELGAGTGMLSIVTAKLLASIEPLPEIIATDYHPDVLANLLVNINTNFPLLTVAKPISVHVLDWESPTDVSPFDRPFDIILAADVVYHPDHVRWIEACVAKLLRRPSGGGRGGTFWLFMALRESGRHEGLGKMVDATFVRKQGLGQGEGRQGVDRLVLLEQEDIQKRDGVGRGDENGYKLSKIGWA